MLYALGLSLSWALLTCLICLKLYSTSRATFWILYNGPSHKEIIDLTIRNTASGAVSERVFIESFHRNRGDFFPFGVKDYLIRSAYLPKWLHWPATFPRIFFFTYPVLVILIAVYSLVYVSQDLGLNVSIVPPILLQLTTILSLLLNTIIIIEHGIGFIVFTDYEFYFHMLGLPRADRKRTRSIAIGALVQITIPLALIFASAFSAILVAAAALRVFDNVPFTSGIIDINLLCVTIVQKLSYFLETPYAKIVPNILVGQGILALYIINILLYGLLISNPVWRRFGNQKQS